MATEAGKTKEPNGAEGAASRDGDLSTFALDVYWASGRGDGAGIGKHVATCARCAAYLADLDALGALAPPAAAIEAELPVRRRWALPLAGGLALAAAVALIVGVRGEKPAERAERAERDGYVGAKGAPAVQLLVHRDRDTRIWDGRSPIHSGDALALRVACEGMKRVVVASPAGAGGGGWVRLSDGACPARDEPLPFTLRVDDQPGDERLAVVLSQGNLDDEILQKAIAETHRTPDTWVVSFVMPKVMETEQ